jgi:hypothetical protein
VERVSGAGGDGDLYVDMWSEYGIICSLTDELSPFRLNVSSWLVREEDIVNKYERKNISLDQNNVGE